ncbi:MAG TPA: hypothetical protein VEZ90_06270 [Blastocatellia bacterium]|jgi:DNA-binding NarL/FixJ family response regulator|nr:hypothetical protein [Blastocatellia bacterium]
MRELIISTFADQSDIELVGEVGNQEDIREAVEESRPDVLILEMDDRNKYRLDCGFLLGRYPDMRILALAPEQNHAVFYWAIVDVRSKALESSEAGILNAVRQRPSVLGTAPV